MLYIWNIQEIITTTLQKHNLDISCDFDNKLSVPMSYNVSTQTIKFNYLKVNGYKAKVDYKLRESDENLIKLLLYHEIGYYLDFKKNKHDVRTLLYGEDDEKEQLMSVIEQNAWQYGRTLVPDQLLESYDRLHELEQPTER
ncbi:hypothetical protein [Jeotgalibacillus campisalis]|uniref:IrrE N-terminal-like domain-containing protein n=1 Tax=Jeotgalibacillus campisalis TaxID=220754 RepID=A0A0C2VSU1_9BACL|nr:hypothetical protein [Jeotgalibacillus campisalis]KIL47043.1 hypothetical protein KR50_23650 [Jeotgalibacillus campisalis]